MRRWWGLTTVFFILSFLISRGSEPAPASMFVLPKIELRKDVKAEVTDQISEKALPSAEVDEFAVSASKTAADSEADARIFEAMNGEPILRRVQTPEEPAGAIGWVETKIWDPVFAPEVVKLGKVEMSGGIVAAIKRKNPFCLLHPLVFVASW